MRHLQTIQLTLVGQSIRSSPDRIEVQGIHTPVAERKFRRCISPQEQSLLTCGILYAFHIACEPDPLILSRLLYGPRQLVRFARSSRSWHR